MALSKKIKIAVFKRDGLICSYCEQEFEDREKLTIDHILPKKFGVTNSIHNLTACCKNCNDAKGHLLLTQFIKAYELTVTRKMAALL